MVIIDLQSDYTMMKIKQLDKKRKNRIKLNFSLEMLIDIADNIN